MAPFLLASKRVVLLVTQFFILYKTYSCETKNFNKRMTVLKTISIVQKVHKDIYNRALYYNDEKILIALSGGQDSMSCLFFSFLMKKQFKVDIIFSTCNHLFQTDSFYSHENNVNQTYAFKKNFSFSLCPYWLSNEKEARYWRYSILEKITSFYGFSSICFSHTQTDRFETLVLQLVRGSGRDGVLSIQWKKKRIFITSSLQPKHISYVRPLLGITRIETFFICKNWNIPFYSDRSNEFFFYKRNFLRKQIVFLLKKNLNPRIERTVCKFLEILAGEESLLNDINKNLIWSSILQRKQIELSEFLTYSHKGNKKRIDIIPLFINKAPLAIRRRFLKNFLKRLYFIGINFEKIQTLGDFFFKKKKESNLIFYSNPLIFYNYIPVVILKKKRKNYFLIENSARKISRDFYTNLYLNYAFSTFPFYYQVANQYFLTNKISQCNLTKTRIRLDFTSFFNRKKIYKTKSKEKKIFSSNLRSKEELKFSALGNFVKPSLRFNTSVCFLFIPGMGVFFEIC